MDDRIFLKICKTKDISRLDDTKIGCSFLFLVLTVAGLTLRTKPKCVKNQYKTWKTFETFAGRTENTSTADSCETYSKSRRERGNNNKQTRSKLRTSKPFDSD